MIILFSLQGAFNGDNTIDEIIFGLELGVLIALFCHFFVKVWLDKHITDLMEGLYVDRYSQLGYFFGVCFLTVFILLTGMYLIAMGEY